MNNLKRAKSPIIVTYFSQNQFDFIKITLKVWSGSILSPSNYHFNDVLPIIKKNRSGNTTVSCNISNYLSPFINPLPNEAYFTGVTPLYGEIINYKYTIDVFKYDGTNITTIETGIHSPTFQASLGYNTNTDILIENADNVLINHEKRFNTYGLTVYNAIINPIATSTDNYINRNTTLNYKYIREGVHPPKQVMFLNKYGILDTFTFPRSSKSVLKMKSDIIKTENKNSILNKNGYLEYIVNTDILDDYNSILLLELMLSDRHWIIDYDNFTFEPITLKNDDFEVKNALNNRAKMNYTLTFITSNNYIQNIK